MRLFIELLLEEMKVNLLKIPFKLNGLSTIDCSRLNPREDDTEKMKQFDHLAPGK